MEQDQTESNTDSKKNLSRRQLMALPVMLAAPTVAEAARLSNVNRSTLYRWLEDDDFRAELTRLQQESLALANSRFKGLMLQASDILEELLHSPNETTRLRALRIGVAYSGQLDRSRSLEEQIDALQNSLPIWARHKKGV